jgi:hypothetical protein
MAITRTTLGAAIDANERFIPLASTTGMLAGDQIIVGEEIMQVNRIPAAGTAKVQRGMAGTASQAHSTGEAADFGQQADFGVFGQRQVDGTGRGAGLQNRGAKTYTAAGAISIQPGLHVLEGAGTAMTLAAPTAEDVGKEMIIWANAATAFVITATTLLRGDSAGTDDTTATFGGAIGDWIRLVVLPDLVYGIVDDLNVTMA